VYDGSLGVQLQFDSVQSWGMGLSVVFIWLPNEIPYRASI